MIDIVGSLSGERAGYAIFTRIAPTLVGAFSAAFVVAVLGLLTNWREAGLSNKSLQRTRLSARR